MLLESVVSDLLPPDCMVMVVRAPLTRPLCCCRSIDSEREPVGGGKQSETHHRMAWSGLHDLTSAGSSVVSTPESTTGRDTGLT
jgi:hypothetical protein